MITHRIAARVFNTLLMIDQRKVEAFLAGFGERLTGGDVEVCDALGAIDHVAFETGRPSLGRLGDGLGRAYDRAGILPFDAIDKVAVIGIEGTLVHKGAFIGQSSGETSYQGLQTQAARALRADSIKAAVLEVDSFGGEGAGAFDAADAIAELSAAKPTMAILTENAHSAGYLLASQARQIVMPEFGGVGSIGAITIHTDRSRQLANAGIQVTILAAGKHKADGNPFEPLPQAVADRTIAALERARLKFADYVGRGRGARMTAAQAMATEADSFGGADALALGMVDAIARPADAFDAFIREVNGTR